MKIEDYKELGEWLGYPFPISIPLPPVVSQDSRSYRRITNGCMVTANVNEFFTHAPQARESTEEEYSDFVTKQLAGRDDVSERVEKFLTLKWGAFGDYCEWITPSLGEANAEGFLRWNGERVYIVASLTLEQGVKEAINLGATPGYLMGETLCTY